MKRLIGFALFWIAVGMMIMLLMKFSLLSLCAYSSLQQKTDVDISRSKMMEIDKFTIDTQPFEKTLTFRLASPALDQSAAAALGEWNSPLIYGKV